MASEVFDAELRSAAIFKHWLGSARPSVAIMAPPEVLEEVGGKVVKAHRLGIKIASVGGQLALLVPSLGVAQAGVVRTLGRCDIRVSLCFYNMLSLSAEAKPGTLLLARDHLRLGGVPLEVADMWARPLAEATPRADRLYDEALAEAALGAAKEEKAKLKQGLLAAMTSGIPPTPAEARLLRDSGAVAAVSGLAEAALAAAASGVRFGAIGGVCDWAGGMVENSSPAVALTSQSARLLAAWTGRVK
ncbi:hypothetical protein FACS1894186_8380 [Alphaproteobacteria bacterium]|nr:hypothetical protein FACS1894186_8380 [Alphaproteobacteria bacterium]